MHDPQRMNPNYFCDLIFLLMPLAGCGSEKIVSTTFGPITMQLSADIHSLCEHILSFHRASSPGSSVQIILPALVYLTILTESIRASQRGLLGS